MAQTYPQTKGLSPRVRGSPPSTRGACAMGGSIPARAGEPPCASGFHSPTGVYPRACGGAPIRRRSWARWAGLSPRVRGSPGAVASRHDVAGSIPARAGEPR